MDKPKSLLDDCGLSGTGLKSLCFCIGQSLDRKGKNSK